MDEEEDVKNICKTGVKLIERLNLFTIFHAVWLIEMYYLGVNVLFKNALLIGIDYKVYTPDFILEYNDMVMEYFHNYYRFAGGVALAIFLCGMANTPIQQVPFFKKYKLIRKYSDYGITCGIWLGIIYETYKLYQHIGIGFLFTPILVFLVVEIMKKFGEYIEEKTGISLFDKEYY